MQKDTKEELRENNGKEIKITVEKGKKLFVPIIIVAAIVVVGMLFLKKQIDDKNKESEIITKSTLEKIINVSELSTFQAIYNGIAQVNNAKKPEKLDFYVAYDAKVQAGIDFKQVKIDVNHEKKKITVIIPEIKITDVNVDITSLDYMFENKDTNTKGVSERAYKACIKDVTEESEKENAIYELAEQSAQNILKALVNPFVEQFDSEYKVNIK